MHHGIGCWQTKFNKQLPNIKSTPIIQKNAFSHHLLPPRMIETGSGNGFLWRVRYL